MAAGSDLEMVVLGIVWKRGPMTPYAIRQEFEHSRSSHFSGSTGAIYPLVRRLETSGHLVSTEDAQGRRPRRLYDITRRGTQALQRWIRPPLSDAATSVPYDALRVRIYFLAALSPAQRVSFLDEAEARLRELLADLAVDRQHYVDSGDVFSELAVLGTIESTRSRLRALALVQNRLDEILEVRSQRPGSHR